MVQIAGGAKWRELHAPPELLELSEKEQVYVQGTVYKSEEKNHYQKLYLKKVSIYQREISFPQSNLIVMADKESKVQAGDIIFIKGKILPMENARNPGNYDQKQFYENQNIFLQIEAEWMERKGSDAVLFYLGKIRESWKEKIYQCCDEKEAGILCGMILGEKGETDEEIKELYRKNGIAHILAVSGLHLSLIGTGIYTLIRKKTGSYALAGFVGTGVLVLYLSVIGWSVSAMRAFLMYALRVGGDVTGRKYDSFTAMAVAAMALFFWRPFCFLEAGLQLSFGAVLGAVIGNKMVKKKQNNVIGNYLVLNVSIFLSTLPIILYHFYEFPLYGIGLNLIVIPCMSLLLLVSYVGILFSGICLPVAGICLKTAGKILLLYELLCKGTSELPFHNLITGRPPVMAIVGYYVLFAGVLFIWKKRRWGVLAIVVLLLACPRWQKPPMEMAILDVGQGDGLVIKSKGKVCMVDGGSSTVKEVGKYRIEPFLQSQGIHTLNYVFVTHGDQDHINGISQLLERQNMGIKIEALVFTERITWDEALEVLAQKAREMGVKVLIMKEKDHLKMEEVSFTCYWPKKQYSGEKGNESSLVLEITCGGFRMLSMGDLEGTVEEAFLEGYEKKCTYLKAAHHGSNHSTTDLFLDRIQPKEVFISAGVNNSYGHPGKETLKRLQDHRCKIWCTKETGAIFIWSDGKTIKKEFFLEEKERYSQESDYNV